jgi:hypothetical protein
VVKNNTEKEIPNLFILLVDLKGESLCVRPILFVSVIYVDCYCDYIKLPPVLNAQKVWIIVGIIKNALVL